MSLALRNGKTAGADGVGTGVAPCWYSAVYVPVQETVTFSML